jgi:AcrR family transcriptional regulator
MSQQRKPERAVPHNLTDEQVILDAAYDLVLAIGMRRLTMADIARQSGVSRATLYRRWPNVQAVVAELMTREFGMLTAPLVDAVGHPVRAALAHGVVHVVGEVRKHPLLRKIVDVDPEVLLPYLLERRGKTTELQLTLLEGYVRAGIAEGSIRDGDAALLARTVLLSAWSFVFTGPLLVTPRKLKALDAELAELLERYLAP